MTLSDTSCPFKNRNNKIINIFMFWILLFCNITKSWAWINIGINIGIGNGIGIGIVPMGHNHVLPHDTRVLSKPSKTTTTRSLFASTFASASTSTSVYAPSRSPISTQLSAGTGSISPSSSPLIIQSLEAVATVSSGLHPSEEEVLVDIISFECQQLGIDFFISDRIGIDIDIGIDSEIPSTKIQVEAEVNMSTILTPGAMGRVLLVEVSGFESQYHFDLLEELELGLCEKIDLLLLQNGINDNDKDGDNDNDGDEEKSKDENNYAILKDAVLVCFHTDVEMNLNKERLGIIDHDNDNDSMDVNDCTRYLSDIVTQHVQEYELALPISQLDEFNNNNNNSNDNDNQQARVNLNTRRPPTERSLVPSMHIEMDGGYVVSQSHHQHHHHNHHHHHHDDDIVAEEYWDSSTLLVFDDLVSQDLRKRLLDVMIGGDSELEYHDARNGPDPNRWVSGVLLDVPDDESSTDTDTGADTGTDTDTNGDNDNVEENDINMDEQEGGWGLKDECLQEICYEPHAAIQEMESILSHLFANFTVSRLPATVLGGDITPLTANAPTAVDNFDYHIDADPNLTPSSPWTDVYGRYPNRARGKPRFMSCLVYLNDEWDSDTWGAPTRFVDVPTDDVEELNVYDIQARPGRCVIMDQDMGHTVVAPNASAGKRPRYSLVWKLILHPQRHGQDMKDLAGKRGVFWPDVEYFGSAAATA